MSTEVYRNMDVIPGDVIHVAKGTHAGWSVTKSFSDIGRCGDTAYFTDASDVLKYLKGIMPQ